MDHLWRAISAGTWQSLFATWIKSRRVARKKGLKQFKLPTGSAALLLMSGGRGLTALAGLATLWASTLVMQPQEFGAISQVTSISALIYASILSPVAIFILRHQHEWDNGRELPDALDKLGRITVAVAALGGLSLLAIQIVSGRNLVDGVPAMALVALVAAYVALFPRVNVGASGLLLFGHRKAYVLLCCLGAWGGLGGAVLGHTIIGGPAGWMFGQFAALALGLYAFGSLRREAAARPVVANLPPHAGLTLRTLVRFGWPQTVIFLLSWLQTQSYRFILEGVADLSAVGVFASGYSLATTAMQTFEQLFNDLYMPKLQAQLKSKVGGAACEVWSVYARSWIPAMVTFGAYLTVAAPSLVVLAFGKRFQGAAAVVVLLAVTETLRACSASLVSQLGAAKTDLRVGLVPNAVGAVLAVVLIPPLARLSPLLGMAGALLLSYLGAQVAAVVMTLRTPGVRWPFRPTLVALVFNLPVIVGGGAIIFRPVLTIGVALAALFGGGLYMVAVQWWFARDWLRTLDSAAPRTELGR